MTTDYDEMLAERAKKAPKRRRNPETIVQKAIVDALTQAHLWVIRVPVQGVLQQLGGGRAVMKPSPMGGMPDLLVLGPEGLTAWLEVKVGKGKLSPIQKGRHERMQTLGHTVAVVGSPEDAIKVLDANGWFEPSLYVTLRKTPA